MDLLNPFNDDLPPDDFDLEPDDYDQQSIEETSSKPKSKPNINPFADDLPPDHFDLNPDDAESTAPKFDKLPSQIVPLAGNLENLEFDDDFDEDFESEKENQPICDEPASKRQKISETIAVANPNRASPDLFHKNKTMTTIHSSQKKSSTLPTLNFIEEINIEKRLAMEKLDHTKMMHQILAKKQEKRLKKKLMKNQGPVVDENLSKTLLSEPSQLGFCKIKLVDSLDFQFYLRKRVVSIDVELDRIAGSSNFFTNFKNVKMNALRGMIDRNKMSKIKKIENDQLKERPKTVVSKRNVQPSRDLLVSVYAPTHFTSLLSDSTTNRLLLKWLQLWDHLVFGKPKPKLPEPPDEEDQPFKSKFSDQKPFQKNFKPLDPILEQYNFDKLNRPKNKIVLLSGPAGLGKTTLAHIAGKHLGYKVQEINSSDDRSAKAIKSSIKKFLSCSDVRNGMVIDGNNNQLTKNSGVKQVKSSQNKSTVHKKPVCLILDEIDGASSEAIEVIIKLINQSPNQVKQKNDLPVLKTPLIAICNDLYTPSLRKLRDLALILHVPQLENNNMVRRLKEIAYSEPKLSKINIPNNVFEFIVEKSEKDIRTALNSLQYVATMKNITVEQLSKCNIGQKDGSKSLFDVWRQFFRLGSSKNYKCIAERKTILPEKVKNKNIQYALKLQYASKEPSKEKLLNGLYENFPSTPRPDGMLKTAKSIMNSITVFDILNKNVKSNQNFTLLRYQTYILAKFHLLYASGSGLMVKSLKYPALHSDSLQKIKQRQQTLASFGRISRDLNVKLPILAKILSYTGSLRAIAPQMFNNFEKQFIKDQAERFVDNKIFIKQEKVEGDDMSNSFGGYRYVLEPNLFTVTNFDEDSSSQGLLKITSNISYAQTQYLANLIEREHVERTETALKARNEPLKDKPKSFDKKLMSTPKTPFNKSTRLTDQMKLLAMQSVTKKKKDKPETKKKIISKAEMWSKFLVNTPKKIDKRPPSLKQNNHPGDLKRFSSTHSSRSTEDYQVEVDPGISTSDVLYRFQKGFCSSVRAKVKIKEFL